MGWGGGGSSWSFRQRHPPCLSSASTEKPDRRVRQTETPSCLRCGHSWLRSMRLVAAGTWASWRPVPAQADSPSQVSPGCAGAQASPAGPSPGDPSARSPGEVSAADTRPCPLPDSQSRCCLRPGEELARDQKGRGSTPGRAQEAGGSRLAPRPRFVPGRPSASPARVLVVVSQPGAGTAHAHTGVWVRSPSPDRSSGRGLRCCSGRFCTDPG